MRNRREGMTSLGEMTLFSHLAEFRNRLIVCAVVFTASMLACLTKAKLFCDILISGASEFSFIYTSPAELFIVYMKLALIGGAVITILTAVYELWRFLRPGLLQRERIAAGLVMIFGLLLFAAGAVFAFRVILPLSIHFFWGLNEGQGVAPLMSIANYVNYVTGVMLSFGVVFELPVAVVLLTEFGLVRAKTLRKYRKYMVLVIFTAAAILTPPDVTSQVLLALPMLGLYEISIVLSDIVGRRADRALAAGVAKNAG